MAALQQQLFAAIPEGFVNLAFVSLYIGNIRFRVARYTIEIAKFTIGYTYIGGVHIPVYNPCYLAMWHLYLTKFISYIY